MIEQLKKNALKANVGLLRYGLMRFTLRKNADDAVHNAVILEEVCKLAYDSLNLNSDIDSIDNNLLDNHFLRKHGANYYYGQSNREEK
ncbi:hypothetical protein [Clostridium folliculivorans]|uniref:hypothetical protein n=1 Tax=Clostridium folliculivorans TaxID=2886038 RepID=UPI0021C305F0|nr:hypothetical protein [Clostridium folliculivorans]GKU28446.1 hypothetical protein CFB3_05520 [Clostridium folliculivorans]